MHTTNLIQLPAGGRRRGRYSDDFKRKVVSACRAPGVSTAAVAQANGLNANLLRRWISESAPVAAVGKRSSAKTLTLTQAAPFIPLPLPAPAQAPVAADTIRIDIERGGTIIKVQWPASGGAHCAAWMTELLKT